MFLVRSAGFHGVYQDYFGNNCSPHICIIKETDSKGKNLISYIQKGGFDLLVVIYGCNAVLMQSLALCVQPVNCCLFAYEMSSLDVDISNQKSTLLSFNYNHGLSMKWFTHYTDMKP